MFFFKHFAWLGLIIILSSCGKKIENIAPPPPKKPQGCGNVLAKFIAPASNTVSNADINKRYILKKDLRGASKSGAFPSLVLDKDDNIFKFLKIFPFIQPGWNVAQVVANEGYLEIVQTCRLGELKSHENLPADIDASIFFVGVYETAFSKSLDPFKPEPEVADSYFPYMLTEAIDNITLTDLAKNKDSLGFNLYSAPKMVLESILLQIIVALKNAYVVWQFIHYDLHTGNILLSKNEKANFSIISDNKHMKLEGPLIKIIDAGLGESKDLKQTGLKFAYIKKRTFILELEDFIQAVSGNISYATKTKIYFNSTNQDIYMFNLILNSLKTILKARGSPLPEPGYCVDYDDCIRMMSTWWH